MKKRGVSFFLSLIICLCACQNEPYKTEGGAAQTTTQETKFSAFETQSAPKTTRAPAEENQPIPEEKSRAFIVEGTEEEINLIREKADISFLETAENDPLYTAFDGVLYDKEMKTLVLVPQGYDRETVFIPDSVEIIGDWAFDRCRNIEAVVMGSGVKEIGGHAFYRCKALREIRFSEGLEYVGSHAFDGCTALEEILLPDSVLPEGHNYMTTWATNVFARCSSLKRVRIPCDTVLACMENPLGRYELENTFQGCDSLEEFILSERAENATVYHGALASASLDAICKLAPKSGVETFTIPSQTAILGTYAFENCTDLKELIIEPYEEAQEHSVILTVTGAGDTWRRTIWIDGGTTINGCSELEKLVVPSDVEIIDINVKDFPKLVIYAERGSNAAKYAEENAIPIRYIEE